MTRLPHVSASIGAAMLLFAAGCSQTAAPAAAPTSAPTAAPAIPSAAPAGAVANPSPVTLASPIPAAAPSAPAASMPSPSTTIPANFFAGKTVTAIVNFSPGGPTDTFARLFIRYLPKYLPGNPTLVVQNVAGAGGHIGNTQLYNVAKPDGFTMGIFTPTALDQIIAPERITDDVTKFRWLGGVTETQISYARADLGIKTPEELPTTKQTIVVGGLSPDSSKDLGERLFLNAIGVTYKYVSGYPGNNDVRAAFERNEVNFFEESLTGWMTAVVPLIETGVAVPMVQRGLFVGTDVKRDPHVPTIPTMTEIAIKLKGPDVIKSLDYRALIAVTTSSMLSRAIVYPPGVDPALVEVVRKAVSDTYLDQEFLAQASKQLGYTFSAVSGAEAQTQIVALVQEAGRDAEVVAYLKKLAQEKP